jgi:hypothetical protein
LILLGFLLVAASPKVPVIVSITPAAPLEIVAGERGEYLMQLNILKGYHIQSNPASQKYLIPLTVKFEESGPLTIGDAVYPPGVPFRLKGSQTDISTYEGNVRIKIPLHVKSEAKPGEVVLKGTLRYQGCDESLCFPPRNLPLEAKLRIVEKR